MRVISSIAVDSDPLNHNLASLSARLIVRATCLKLLSERSSPLAKVNTAELVPSLRVTVISSVVGRYCIEISFDPSDFENR